jgi:hypothetical protein
MKKIKKILTAALMTAVFSSSALADGTININDGTGSGDGDSGSQSGTVIITGGSVKMNNHNRPIPKDGNNTAVYLNTLTVGKSLIAANTCITEASIGGVSSYGINGVETDADGNVYFFLPESADKESVTLTANSNKYSLSYKREANNSNNPRLILLYGILLSQTGTLSSVTYGYDTPASLDVTVTNAGDNATGDLNIALSGAGSSAFTTSPSPISSIDVCNTGSFTFTPKTGLNAGTYTATGTVSNSNINTSFDVSFEVNKATPTVEYLEFKLGEVAFRGVPLGIDTPVLVDPYTGLGAITVKYNGVARLPDEPGTYTVTIDIAEGANFTAATNLLLGRLTILEPPPPPTIIRRIILPKVQGATTDPPAGTYSIVSGSDFVFTLIPLDSSAETPVVTSGREEKYNIDGGVICMPNGDGSYTVRILQIRQNISIGIAFDGANATTLVEGTRVWSYGSRVYITAARSGEARIYNLAGIRVKTLALPAGETVSETLATGLYIVVIEDQTRKFSIKN